MEIKGSAFKAVALAHSAFTSGPKADVHIKVMDEGDGLGIKAEVAGNVSGMFTAASALIFEIVDKYDCDMTIDDVVLAIKMYGDMREGHFEEKENIMRMVKAIAGDDKQGNV